MPRKLNGTAKWAGVILTALAALVGVAWAQANAANQIDANTASISVFDGRLSNIERLLVAIAQNDGIDVSVLFAK